MAINMADLAITSLDSLTAYTLDGDYLFTLDELQDTTISNTEEKEDITGRAGRKLMSLKRNKAVTVSGSNGLLSVGLLEAQTGGDFEQSDEYKVTWTDYLAVSSNAATTEWTAVGTAGSEIIALYVRNANGTAGTALKQAEEAAEGKFAYDPETKQLTFSGLQNNTEIIVVYERQVKGARLVNDSTKFSKRLRVYIDGTAEDKCGNTFHVQYYFPKGDFNGEFEIAMGDSQVVHDFEFDAEISACGLSGARDALWTFTVFGAEQETSDGGVDPETGNGG